MNKPLRTFINLAKKTLRTLRKILALLAVKPHKIYKNKKASHKEKLFTNLGGLDGTRTRDPMRDRHVF